MSLTTVDEIERRVRHETILHATQPRASRPSELLAAAHFTSKLAERIETRWNELSEEEKQDWRAFAAYSLEPRRGLREMLSNFTTGIRLSYVVFLAVVTGQADSVLAYFGTVIRLRGAVLRAIEREHPDYEALLVQAAKDALDDIAARKAVTPEEFREWLDTISSNPLRRISA